MFTVWQTPVEWWLIFKAKSEATLEAQKQQQKARRRG